MSTLMTFEGSPVGCVSYVGPERQDGSSRRMVQVTNMETGHFVQMRYCDFVQMVSEVLPQMLRDA